MVNIDSFWDPSNYGGALMSLNTVYGCVADLTVKLLLFVIKRPSGKKCQSWVLHCLGWIAGDPRSRQCDNISPFLVYFRSTKVTD